MKSDLLNSPEHSVHVIRIKSQTREFSMGRKFFGSAARTVHGLFLDPRFSCGNRSRPSRRDPTSAISSILRGSPPEGELYLFRVVQERHAPLASGERGEGEKWRAAVGCRCKDLAAEKLPVIFAIATRRMHGTALHGTTRRRRSFEGEVRGLTCSRTSAG